MSGDLRLDPNAFAVLQKLKTAPPPGETALRDTAPPPVNAPAPAPALPSAGSAKARADLPNPRLHTDLALNRLVLEFYNAQGALTNSIPSQKQLQAYRLAAFAGEPGRGAKSR